MLNKIPKIITGDMLKALSDMGHGDVLILADANFPGKKIAAGTSFGKLIRCPGADVTQIFDAVSEFFPLDFAYTKNPACVMDLTDSDKKNKMPIPAAWQEFSAVMKKSYSAAGLGAIERNEFYKRAEKAYVIIQTGEERIYGNLLLVKGCVL